MEALDQRPAARVLVWIECLERMAVAPQEALQSQHVAAAGASDDDRSAGAALEQSDAAQDQRAHDALAELGLGDEQRAQLLGRNDQRLDRLRSMRVDQCRARRQRGKLAHEAAGRMRDDRCGAPPPSCCVMSTLPDRMMVSPRPTSPARTSASPAP